MKFENSKTRDRCNICRLYIDCDCIALQSDTIKTGSYKHFLMINAAFCDWNYDVTGGSNDRYKAHHAS